MKTNTFNYFRNAFAIVGFFIIACSVGTADDPTVEPEPPVQSNIGKYQISTGAPLSGYLKKQLKSKL